MKNESNENLLLKMLKDKGYDEPIITNRNNEATIETYDIEYLDNSIRRETSFYIVEKNEKHFTLTINVVYYMDEYYGECSTEEIENIEFEHKIDVYTPQGDESVDFVERYQCKLEEIHIDKIDTMIRYVKELTEDKSKVISICKTARSEN